MATDPEWLETDARGGFALGTVSGIRRRRYHSLLTVGDGEHGARSALLKGLVVWIESGGRVISLSPQLYAPGVLAADPTVSIEAFSHRPFPHWTIRAGRDVLVQHELFLSHGRGALCVRWQLTSSPKPLRLCVRPLLGGGSFHHLQRCSSEGVWDERETPLGVVFQRGASTLAVLSNGQFAKGPDWYHQFFYTEEQARGYDSVEDLFTPGVFSAQLSQNDELVMVIEGQGAGELRVRERQVACLVYHQLRSREVDARSTYSAADQFIVSRGSRRTIIAGYPWFEDWGRDTFIALRGISLARGRLEEAQEILNGWSGLVRQGLLPNRFPDGTAEPEYNSVDAALWFVVVVEEFFAAAAERSYPVTNEVLCRLRTACEEIVGAYLAGTEFGIYADLDGLLMAGFPETQLTWMDARIDGVPVTPRAGKPVEIQCLWMRALSYVSQWRPGWREHARRAEESFARRFVRPEGGGLYDVIDVNGEPGTVDARIRPNQIFAAGGLSRLFLPTPAAQRVVDEVERELLVVSGLRSLGPREPGYVSRYEGDVRQRDRAYHQGIVWPWLLGPFVEAWVKVRGDTAAARVEARERFFKPFVQHFEGANLGAVSELTDAEPPFAPRGCVSQAWSVGEQVRMDVQVLRER